jgi:hypothetical protein
MAETARQSSRVDEFPFTIDQHGVDRAKTGRTRFLPSRIVLFRTLQEQVKRVIERREFKRGGKGCFEGATNILRGSALAGTPLVCP